jgi:hypothetical protein
MDLHLIVLLIILVFVFLCYRIIKSESKKQTELLADLVLLTVSVNKREDEESPIPQLKNLKQNTIDKKYL